MEKLLHTLFSRYTGVRVGLMYEACYVTSAMSEFRNLSAQCLYLSLKNVLIGACLLVVLCGRPCL